MNKTKEQQHKALLKQVAEANGIPYKLAQKWDVVFGTLGHQLQTLYGLQLTVKGSVLEYKQYEIYIEIEEKSRLYAVVRVGEKLVLGMLVKSTTPAHLGQVTTAIGFALDAKPIPGKAMQVVHKS